MQATWNPFVVTKEFYFAEYNTLNINYNINKIKIKVMTFPLVAKKKIDNNFLRFLVGFLLL